MASTVATPLERALGTIAGVNEMSLEQLAGLDAHQHPVRPRQGHQRRRARGAGGHQRQPLAAAERAAGHAAVPQDQPVAGADHDPGADVEDAHDQSRSTTSPRRCWRRRWRRSPASATSRSAADRCRRSASSCSPSPDAVRHRARRGPALDRAAPTCCGPRAWSRTSERFWQIQASDQLTKAEAVRAAHRHLPQRRPGPAVGRRQGHRRRRGSLQQRLLQRPTRRCC